MTDDFDLQELFGGLSDDQVREVLGAMKEKATALKQPQPATPNYDEAEAAEITAIKVRGPNYALQKRNIIAKYSALRNQQPPPVDEEIEKVKDDPRALKQLYLSRIGTIQRGDPMALHKKNEIAAPFRKKGLNV
jgi:hypothetical protein